MQVIFHAGFHKTGTTSIQQALQTHAPQLSALFQIQTRRNNTPFSAAAIAARAYSADPGTTTLQTLRRALKDWTQNLSLQKGQGLLCSCEDFSGHIPSRYGLTDYRHAVTILPELASSLRHRFGAALDLKVLFTTRAAEPWLRSIHWQLAKSPELTLKQRRFCKDYASAADFAAVLTPLAVALGPVPLHQIALENLIPRRLGPVEALYDLAELPDTLRARLPALPPANTGPPMSLADPFIELNRSGLPPEEIDRIKRDMRALAETLHKPDPEPEP